MVKCSTTPLGNAPLERMCTRDSCVRVSPESGSPWQFCRPDCHEVTAGWGWKVTATVLHGGECCVENCWCSNHGMSLCNQHDPPTTGSGEWKVERGWSQGDFHLQLCSIIKNSLLNKKQQMSCVPFLLCLSDVDGALFSVLEKELHLFLKGFWWVNQPVTVSAHSLPVAYLSQASFHSRH